MWFQKTQSWRASSFHKNAQAFPPENAKCQVGEHSFLFGLTKHSLRREESFLLGITFNVCVFVWKLRCLMLTAMILYLTYYFTKYEYISLYLDYNEHIKVFRWVFLHPFIHDLFCLIWLISKNILFKKKWIRDFIVFH